MSNARTTRIAATKTVAKKTRDEEFVALLRRKCLRAATVGAFTAAGEAIPGLSRVLGFVFGELLDARFLAQIQRELIEETFMLYELELPAPVRETLVGHVQLLGTSASVAGDSPTNAELETAANWTRVWENKNVRIVAIEHNN